MKYTVEINTSAREQPWLEKAAEVRGMTVDALVQAIAENCCRVFLEQAIERNMRRAALAKDAPIDFSAAHAPAPIKWPKYGKAVRR